MSCKTNCPDNDNCEDITENHFRQLSHPHLEEVLKGRLEDDVTFHYVLHFMPRVRFLRYDQLVVLQKVLLEEKAASKINKLTVSTQNSNNVVQKENRIDNQVNILPVKCTSSQNVGTLPNKQNENIATPVVNKPVLNKTLIAVPTVNTSVASTIISSMQQNPTINNNSKLHVKSPVASTMTSLIQQNSTINNHSVTKLHVQSPVASTNTSSMQHNNSMTKPSVKTPIATKTLNLNTQNSTTKNLTNSIGIKSGVLASPINNKITKAPAVSTSKATPNNTFNSLESSNHLNIVIPPNNKLVINSPISKLHISSNSQFLNNKNNKSITQTVKFDSKNQFKNKPTTSQTTKFNNKQVTQGIILQNKPATVQTNNVYNNFSKQISKSVNQKASQVVQQKVIISPASTNNVNKKPLGDSASTIIDLTSFNTPVNSKQVNNSNRSTMNKQTTTPSTSASTSKVNEKPLGALVSTTINLPSYNTSVNSIKSQQVNNSNLNILYQLIPVATTSTSTNNVNKKPLGISASTIIDLASFNTPVNSIKSQQVNNSNQNTMNKQTTTPPTLSSTSKVDAKPLGPSASAIIDSTSYNTLVNPLESQPNNNSNQITLNKPITAPSNSILTSKVNEKSLGLVILTQIDPNIPVGTLKNQQQCNQDKFIKPTSEIIVEKKLNNSLTENLINSIDNDSTSPSSTLKKRQSNSSIDFESKKYKKDSVNNLLTEHNYFSLLRKYDDCRDQNDRLNIRLEALDKICNVGPSISNLQSQDKFINKYNNASPYYLFYSLNNKNSNNFIKNNTIIFPEILDLSFGIIQSSFHITSLLDINWLRQQYLLAAQKCDSFIIYNEINKYNKIPKNIKTLKMNSSMSKHNTKLSVINYDNGSRIVILTGNLNENDWSNNLQAVWISPHLPYLPEGINPSAGESVTGFKADFMNYLRTYKSKKLENLLKLIVKLDFSSINVFFISSVPGIFNSNINNQWGINKVSELIKKHSVKISNNDKYCPVIAQTSVANNLKSIDNDWLHKQIIQKLTNDNIETTPTPSFKFIYPSINNYQNSSDANNNTNDSLMEYLNFDYKQEWLKPYLYQWTSYESMTNINCYTKLSSEFNKISWFILTSHNLSKYSWGYSKNHDDDSTTISNYEAGIIFFPKFLISKDTFPLVETNENETPIFTLPYNLPLTPYGPDDKPYVTDYVGTAGK